MFSNQSTIHTRMQGLIDLILFFSMFGMLLYNVRIKRKERRDHNPGRRGRWRPELIYIPVLLLRWVFVPHGNDDLNRKRNMSFKHENVDHHKHGHHYHHVHDQNRQNFMHRVDSSFLENEQSDISLPEIIHGQ